MSAKTDRDKPVLAVMLPTGTAALRFAAWGPINPKKERLMKLSHLVIAAVLATVPAGIALAQAPAGGGRGAMMQACGADIQANCAGQTGRGARQCLQANEAKLSAGCKAALAAMPMRGGNRGGGAPAGQ
jgi:hypothetical protein